MNAIEVNADQLKRERDAYRDALVTAALELRAFRISRMDIAVYIERVIARHQPEERRHVHVSGS